MGSYGILFKPLLLSLFSVPSLHIHKYLFLFNYSSLLGSASGAWARIWNLTVLELWLVSLQYLNTGLLSRLGVRLLCT